MLAATAAVCDSAWAGRQPTQSAGRRLRRASTLLTETELNAATSNPASSSEKVRPVLEEYSSFHKVVQKMSPKAEKIDFGDEVAFGVGTNRNEPDETRVFVSDKLWRTYSALVGVHGRLGFLVSKSMESGEVVDWKKDPHMKRIVSGTLPSESWRQIERLELSGFRAMAGLLEQQFIVEAKKNMRGADEFAEAVAEVGQITEQEEARARCRKEDFLR